MIVQPAPARDEIVDGNLRSWTVTKYWHEWCAILVRALKTCDAQVGRVASTSNAATIGASDIPLTRTTSGLYAIRYYVRVTRAATSSSSLTVVLAWTDGGVACQHTGAALTGNTTATNQSGTVVARLDAGTVPRYAVTYATSGATTALYAVDISVQEIP